MNTSNNSASSTLYQSRALVGVARAHATCLGGYLKFMLAQRLCVNTADPDALAMGKGFMLQCNLPVCTLVHMWHMHGFMQLQVVPEWMCVTQVLCCTGQQNTNAVCSYRLLKGLAGPISIMPIGLSQRSTAFLLWVGLPLCVFRARISHQLHEQHFKMLNPIITHRRVEQGSTWLTMSVSAQRSLQ